MEELDNIVIWINIVRFLGGHTLLTIPLISPYYYWLHVISSYAISTAAISTVHTFNRLPFRPLANLTAANSTYLIKFKVIHSFSRRSKTSRVIEESI